MTKACGYATMPRCQISMLINLELAPENIMNTLSLDNTMHCVLGVNIPQYQLFTGQERPLALLVEIMVKQHLKKYG